MSGIRRFEGKRILVTGAAGFIGSHLVRALVKASGTVHGLVSPASNLQRLETVVDQIRLWRGDTRDGSFVQHVVTETTPQIVYHLADYGIRQGQTDLNQMISVNVLGLCNLLDALREIPLECFVNSGTSAEYGPKSQPMEESEVLHPDTFYGASKAAGSLLSQAFGRSQKRRVITLRLFCVYGPQENPNRFIPTAIRSCLEGSVLRLTSRQEKRDFVFIEDVVEAFLLAACNIAVRSEIINIGTGVETTLEQVVGIVESCVGKKLQFREGAYENRQWSSPCWAPDVRNAAKILGWKPTHDLERGLRKTVHWVQSEMAAKAPG